MVGWKGIMSLRAYVTTCDAIHYLRLLGADCSKFGMNIICHHNAMKKGDYLHYNFTEKNKFEENRTSMLAEDVNNSELGTENSVSQQIATENGDNMKEDDNAEIPVETNESLLTT